jgi:hypothetical protein
MSRRYHKSLILCQLLQVFLDQKILHPVLAYLSGLTVSYQFIRIKGDVEIQVVVDHDLESFSFNAFPFILIDGFCLDLPVRAKAIAVYSAPCEQLFEKFRNQLFVPFRRYISESVLKRQYGIFFAQGKLPDRGPPYPFNKRFLRRQLPSETDFHRVCNARIIQQLIHLLFTVAVPQQTPPPARLPRF